jgi:hypothetical protein
MEEELLGEKKSEDPKVVGGKVVKQRGGEQVGYSYNATKISSVEKETLIRELPIRKHTKYRG